MKLINKADEGELLKPWHRVQFNKDGSVQSCERVDGAKNERGGYTQYVQADSKEEAIAKAQKLVAAYEKRLLASRESTRRLCAERNMAGLCTRCGTREPRSGLRECAVCAEQFNAYRKAYRAGAPLTRTPPARTPEETLAASERLRNRYNEKTFRAQEVFGSVTEAIKTRGALVFARRALDEFSKSARACGVAGQAYVLWLVAQIRDMETDLAKCRKQTEQEAVAAE